MFIAMYLACALAQGVPEAKTAPDAALFDELIRKTNGLHSFVANYRIRPAGQEETGEIRIVYSAPDRAKIEMQTGQRSTVRVMDGFADLRAVSKSGEPVYAHVPVLGSMRERYDQLTGSIRAELPDIADRWLSGGEAGLWFGMKTTPGAGASEGKFSFTFGYEYPHDSLLLWLGQLAKRTDGRLEGSDHIVFEDPDGTKLTLSSVTGFIERIEKKKKEGVSSIELVELVTDREVDAIALDLSPPDASATDVSGDFAAQIEQVWTCRLRMSLFRWIAKVVREKGMEWTPEARANVGTVLQELHADALGKEYGAWIAAARKNNEKWEAWVRDRMSRLPVGDSSDRSEIEGKVRDRRERLEESFAHEVESRRSGLGIEVSTVPDDDLRKSLTDLEELAARAAYEEVVREPVLRDFEDRVKNALGGH